MQSALFTPFKIGGLTLPNRVVHAALTRCRTSPATGVPNDAFVEYYSSRASAGLIMTESVSVSMEANAYPGSGCLYTDEQEAGWAKVVKGVHDKGGRIFVQLFHAGRAAFPEQIQGQTPIA